MNEEMLANHDALVAALEPYLGLGEWTRDVEPNWSPLPPLGQGTKPATWSHNDWPEETP